MIIKYFAIGILNTIIHWVVFGVCFIFFNINQSVSNLLAFLVAVTFSFVMNAKFTFNKKPTSMRYILFICFMGILSFMVGEFADYLYVNPIITLITFSMLSFILGFLYSKFIVFK